MQCFNRTAKILNNNWIKKSYSAKLFLSKRLKIKVLLNNSELLENKSA